MVKEMLLDAEAVGKLAPAEGLKFKRIGRGLLLQRAFGGALAVVGKRTLRRAQYAAIRPVGRTVLQLAAMMPKPCRAVRQAAFDAAIGVGSGEHGLVPVGWFWSVAGRLDAAPIEFNTGRRDCKIHVTKFDVYVKRNGETAQRRMVLQPRRL
ncbi:hypothetical protein BFX40_15545 [Mesorhizobium sp. SEMIA 3007]|nr:hypothetical protein BFX40_15545 [Mesorhizobium sp. SEMIA 3007]BCH11179.1 hypothetical protein MesoLj131c_54370 [Mesorhizobium sp. 131-3-5]